MVRATNRRPAEVRPEAFLYPCRVSSPDGSVLSSVRKRLLRGSSWVLAGRVGSVVLGVVINAFLARLLSPAEYGAYFTNFTLVMVGSLIAQLGLDRAVVRLVAASLGTGVPGRAREAIRITLGLGAAGAAVAGAALAIGLGPALARNVFDSEIVATVLPISAGWLFATALQSLLVETFRGLQHFGLATIFDSLLVDVLAATTFGALVAFGTSRMSLAAVLWILTGITGLVALLAALFLRPRYARLGSDGHLERGEVAAIAWPSLITNVSIYFLGTGVDLLVLGAFRPQPDVALYGAATRLVTLVATPLWIIRGAMTPLISELHAQGRTKELERTARAGATLAGLPSFVVLLAFLALGPFVMNVLYGSYYEDGAGVLAILSLGRMLAVWAGPCGMTLMMTGHQRAMMVVTVVTGLLSVGLGALAAPEFGGAGVATTTTAVIVLQNALLLVLARRRVGVWTHMEFSPRALRHFFRPKEDDAPSEPR